MVRVEILLAEADPEVLQRLQALITMALLVLTIIRTMHVLQRLQAPLTAYTAAACTINACTLHGAHVHVHVHGESTACAWRVLHGSTLGLYLLCRRCSTRGV